MTLLHIISSVAKINFGVWNVVLSTFSHLKSHNCQSIIAFPVSEDDIPEPIANEEHLVIKSGPEDIMHHYDLSDTLIITHGNWTLPTKWGHQLAQKGYKWIAVPHGMLEPWSMNHKKWKKKIYYSLFERNMLQKANAIIAVGAPEYDNLKRTFGEKVVRVPNGIVPYVKKEEGRWKMEEGRRKMEEGRWKKDDGGRKKDDGGRQKDDGGWKMEEGRWEESSDVRASESKGNQEDEKKIAIDSAVQQIIKSTNQHKRIFLFLGRLHAKKGVVPLVQAWLDSPMAHKEHTELWIAGPDEGEGRKLEALMASADRISNFDKEESKELVSQLPIDSTNQQIIKSTTPADGFSTPNVKILGPVYGNDKEEVLKQADFFVLPSQSEGFPTSIIESMTYGCVPVITDGCNFPEAFENEVAIKVKFDKESIRTGLEKGWAMQDEALESLKSKAKTFADENFNLQKIADMQYELYKRVMDG